MSKSLKIIIGLFLVLVIAAVIAISLVDVNQYKGEIIQLVEDKTGRKFAIDGDFQLGISLIPTVIVEGVRFGNAAWRSEENMLRVDRFEVQVSLIPLISGNIHVNRLILTSPEILLETNKDGQGNWVFATKEKTKEESPEAEKTGTSTLPALNIKEVRIKDAKFTYRDGITGKVNKITIDEISAGSGGYSEPMMVVVKASYNDLPITLNGTLGSLGSLATNSDYPVSIKTTVSDAKLGLDGKIAQPMQAKGLDFMLSFEIDSLSSLKHLTGSDLPEIGPVSLYGKVSDREGAYVLNDLKFHAGDTDLSGDIALKMQGKRPTLTANIRSKVIDLSAFSGGKKEAEKKERLFSPEPLQLDGLKAVDADLNLTAGQVRTAAVVLENVKITLKLSNGKLKIMPVNATLSGGSLSSNLELDATGETPALTMNVDINNFRPDTLPDLKDKLSGGKTSIKVNARGAGKSVSAIMAGLNGNLLIQVGEGKLKGQSTDLISSDVLLKTYRMLNPAAPDDAETRIECGVVKFTIKDGIATADKGIALATNKMNIIGSGVINLKTEELDIGVTPQAREGVGISVGQLAELVRLGGTLANPSPVTDTKAAFKAGLSAGAAVATGGLSILAQGLYDRATADEDPCAIALGTTTTKSASAQKDPPVKSTTDKTITTVKEAGGAIKDKLKKLFGR